MKQQVSSCNCADYSPRLLLDSPHIANLFGHEYCSYCQSPDETDWWNDVTPAQRTAWMIWRDLRGRRGFKQELDIEIENSILEEWTGIIQKEME